MRWGILSGALCVLLLSACYREPRNQWERDANADVEKQAATETPATPDAPGPADEAAPAADQAEGGPQVVLGAMRLMAPESWVRKPASSDFVMTEFALPKAEGDAQDGRLTVSTAGGSVEANIERWKGQFAPEPTASSQETLQVGDVEITFVDLAGTFKDQRGPFAPATQYEGYRMLAAIVPLAGQQYFIKAYGPEKTMAAYVSQFKEFLNTLAPADK